MIVTLKEQEGRAQVLPLDMRNALERKSLRYLGHSRRNDSETDIAFSRAQNGPAPKLSLRLGRIPAPENKTRIARFWISDSR